MATEYPGVAKFGIALEWGSRGLEFESQHSDQNILTLWRGDIFLFLMPKTQHSGQKLCFHYSENTAFFAFRKGY